MTVQALDGDRQQLRGFSCLSVGDPVTDIVAKVTQSTLQRLGVDAGGCTLLETEQELAQLRTTIASEASETLEAPGGSAANVSACIAALIPEASCHFAGAIGSDPTGQGYTDHLQRAAVQPHFVTAEAHPSAVSVCLVTPDGQRTMRTCLGAASSFEKHHLPEASKAAGATFSLDMASFEVVRNCWTSLQPIIESGRVEVLFCNEDEAREIVSQYGLKDPSEQESLDQMIGRAGSLLTQHCKVAVFTLGSRGAVAVSGDRALRCGANKVQVADTVGAGDAFCGAFLATYMRGQELQACLEMGCAAGAEAVQCPGARLPAMSIQSLREKLEGLTGDL